MKAIISYAGLIAAILCSSSVVQALISKVSWDLDVYVQVDTRSIRQVSAALGQYVFDGVISYAWMDPSLSKYQDDSVYGVKQGCSSAYFPVGGNCPDVGGATPYPIVTPDIKGLTGTSKNVITWSILYGTPDFIPEIPQNLSMPWVVGVQSLSVTVIQAQNLRKFPMDTQVLKFALENSNVQSSAMRFKFVEKSLNSLHPPSDPDGYDLIATSTSVYTSTDSGNHSGLMCSFTLARISELYMYRFVLPLLIITVLVMCLQFASTSARTMSAFTVIGTTTSFIFISSNSVPQLPYRTRLDNFFIFQFFIALFLGAWNIYSTNRVDRFKKVYIKTIVNRVKAAKAKAEAMATAAKERAEKMATATRNGAASTLRAGGTCMGCPALRRRTPDTATVEGSSEVALALDGKTEKEKEKEKEKERIEDEILLSRVATEFDLTQWEYYLSEGDSEKSSHNTSMRKNTSATSLRSLASKHSSFYIEHNKPHAKKRNFQLHGLDEELGLEVIPEPVELHGNSSADDGAPKIASGNQPANDGDALAGAHGDNKLPASKIDFGEIPALIRGILEFHQLGLKFADKKSDDEQLMADVQFQFDSISIGIFLTTYILGVFCIFLT